MSADEKRGLKSFRSRWVGDAYYDVSQVFVVADEASEKVRQRERA